MLERGDQKVGVLGAAVNHEVVVRLVEEEDLGALVGDRFHGLDVAGLLSDIAEAEEQVAVVVIGEDLGALFVDDGPRAFRTGRRVDDLGRAGDVGGGEVGDADFAGRRIEAVALHDVRAGCGQLLDRRVGGIL